MKIFFAYYDKNQFYNKNITVNIISVFFLSRTLKKRRLQKVKILFEKLNKLLYLKTK